MIGAVLGFFALLGLAKALGSKRPVQAYDAEQDAIVPVKPSEPERRRDPPPSSPPERREPERAMVPVVKEPAVKEPSVVPKKDPPKPPVQIIPQPKGTTGNLPNETRPLGTSNFNPERAFALAPQVLDALVKRPQLARPLVLELQRCADMQPTDGVYGPRTAGALQYFAQREGQPAPKIPPPYTKDKRIIPYRI